MGGPRNSTGDSAESPASQALPGLEQAPPGLDDAELMRRIARGDEKSFRALVDRHARYLYGIANSLSGNPTDADDLVQETLAAVLEAHFRGESSVRTFLVSILVRKAGMLRRSARRSEKDQQRGTGAGVQESPASGVDARLDVGVMLETLSMEHRQVVVLRELEAMSYDEIAQALGVPRGTVESRLHRARAQLRERFRDFLA